jgi:homocysteine S-methyltransferase
VPFPAAWIHDPFTVVDGGLSTALEALGHHPAGLLWTAQLVLDAPDVVVAAHRSFVDAGAEVVITASYQASVAGFERAGADPVRARRALAGTTELARRAGAPLVAASIGPFGAVVGDGSEYHGRYDVGWEEVRRFHRARIDVLADTGPDLFAVETVPSLAEAQIVVEELAARSRIPAWVCFSCRDGRTTCAGDDVAAAAAAVVSAGGGVVGAVGVNCTDPRHVAGLLAGMAATGLPLVAYPNHGRAWDGAHGCWVGDEGVAADALADAVPSWVAAGARFVGGCCGIGPASVRRIAAARAELA